MKVVHVIKQIEMIDQDVKELKKLEKQVKTNKSFSTPIYMSIEKQINILLGDRIKLLELKIENPPEKLVEEIEGEVVDARPILPSKSAPMTEKKKKAKKAPKPIDDDMDDDEIPMLTQDQIDAKFSSIEQKKEKKKKFLSKSGNEEKKNDDEGVKILDIALEKGTLGGDEEKKDKKVKFFRDNFPVE